MNEPTRIDPELGPVRYCARCEMWLPDDREFWIHDVRRAGSRYVRPGRPQPFYVRHTPYVYRRCRSCFRERVNGRRRERAAA